MSGAITVTTDIDAPLDAVWTAWTAPEHITQWNQASPDWHCPKASNDLRPGGLFSSTMAARDGSFEFEFGGEHTAVVPHERIESRLGDGRTMQVVFESGKEYLRTIKVLVCLCELLKFPKKKR